MGIFTQLDVVNDMLGLLGEAGVNTLNEEHPLIARGLAYLKTANVREQAQGWWFNTEQLRLVPTSDGEIIVPADILSLDPVNPCLQYATRGGKLTNLNPGTGSPSQFTSPVCVQIVRLLDYEDLPTQAQLLVSLSGQLDFARAVDADDAKVRLLLNSAKDARITLCAEHIRAKDVNLLQNPSFMATFGGLRGPGYGRLQHR